MDEVRQRSRWLLWATTAEKTVNYKARREQGVISLGFQVSDVQKPLTAVWRITKRATSSSLTRMRRSTLSSTWRQAKRSAWCARKGRTLSRRTSSLGTQISLGKPSCRSRDRGRVDPKGSGSEKRTKRKRSNRAGSRRSGSGGRT